MIYLNINIVRKRTFIEWQIFYVKEIWVKATKEEIKSFEIKKFYNISQRNAKLVVKHLQEEEENVIHSS